MKRSTIRIEAAKGEDFGSLEIDVSKDHIREGVFKQVLESIVKPLQREGWQVTWKTITRPPSPASTHARMA